VARFIIRRALDSLITLVVLLILVFCLTRVTGDPARLFLPETASVAEREAFAISQGYADPIYMQFGRYVLGLLQLDFGRSMFQQRPAIEAVADALPTTLRLASICLTVSVLVALTIGCLAASKPMGLFDRVATFLSLIGGSAPDFWIAIVGILVFAVALGWLPTSGMGGIEYWIMPVIVVSLRPVAVLTQVVRGAMISSLSAPYVKTARAKGVSDLAILVRHALRSSLLPTITVIGNIAVGMINGSVIAETVFGLPGMGKLLIEAISQRDFAVVQTVVMIVAIGIFVLNILIDVLYVIVDPRIRHT
jgi:peptide/nickel transport system permease protein